MQDTIVGSTHSAHGTRSLRFVLAVDRGQGHVYKADFSTLDRTVLAIEEDAGAGRLHAVCAEIWRTPSGNIRLWQSKLVQVMVDVVDLYDGFIGGDDIDTVPAQLNLQTGEVVLDNPKLGCPLLNWSDIGVSIKFDGKLYTAKLLSHNVPDDMSGTEVEYFIKQHGYRATVDLSTLQSWATQ